MDYPFSIEQYRQITAGSFYYYAYRKLDSIVAEKLFTLEALKFQWIKTSEFYQDKTPATHKLIWWQQELSRLKAATPSMPLSERLFHHYHNDNQPLWFSLIESLEEDLNYALETLMLGRHDLHEHCRQNYIGIAKIQAAVVANIDKEHIYQFNRCNEIIRHLFCIRRHSHRDICLDKQLRPDIHKNTFKNIANHWYQEAQNAAGIFKQAEPDAKSLHKLNKMHLKLAKKWIAKVNNPFKQGVTFSSLNYLFASL
ncbi:MAG: hypothetical protein ACO2ZM_04685 [Francisellaceae bacterium]